MKALGGEVATVLSIAAVAVAGGVTLSPSVLRFGAGAPVALPASVPVLCVELDPATEASVVWDAKDSWRKGGMARGRVYADLSSRELPVERLPPVLSVSSRPAPPPLPVAKVGIPGYLPSCRAAPPIRLPTVDQAEAPVFSREELLKID